MAKKKTKKSDLDLRAKIKDMEKAKRSQILKTAKKVNIVTGDSGDIKISFDQWWMLINKRIRIKQWMKEIILVDFQARGLTKSESEAKYNDALRLFGIKF